MSGSDTDSLEDGTSNNRKPISIKVKPPEPKKPPVPPIHKKEDDGDYVDDFDERDEEEEAIERAKLLSRKASIGSASSARSASSAVASSSSAPKVVLHLDQPTQPALVVKVAAPDPNAPGKNVNVRLVNTTDANANDGSTDDETYSLGAKVHNHIRQVLSKSQQVMGAIQQIQKQFALKSQAAEPIMPYFDQLAVSRHEVHEGLLVGLRDVLTAKIENLSAPK
jgi:hypothetical protein